MRQYGHMGHKQWRFSTFSFGGAVGWHKFLRGGHNLVTAACGVADAITYGSFNFRWPPRVARLSMVGRVWPLQAPLTAASVHKTGTHKKTFVNRCPCPHISSFDVGHQRWIWMPIVGINGACVEREHPWVWTRVSGGTGTYPPEAA